MISSQTFLNQKEERINQSHLISLEVFSHMKEFNRVVKIFREDDDLLITGVPGSGRYTLVKRAAQQIGARLIKVDCIKATNGIDLVNLLLKNTYQAFGKRNARNITKRLLSNPHAQELFKKHHDIDDTLQVQLSPKNDKNLLWSAFQIILQLPGQIAEELGVQVVLVLKQISHLRSWDRDPQYKWEGYLRLTINKDPKVSYVILETVAELEELKKPLKDNEREFYEIYPDLPIDVIQLKPLPNDVLEFWLVHKSKLALNNNALQKFLNSVQGHIGSAEALLKRLELMYEPDNVNTEINENQVKKALHSLLEDLSIVFESLLLMLPANQLRLIECLAIESTPKPHSKEYRSKYNLARGGTLQGAIKGLQQKGLIYRGEDNFQLTLPLFANWIKTNLI